MPEPAPEPSRPEPKPSPPRAGPPPRDPDAPPEAPSEGALFHALLEGGFDPSTAYTAEKQVQAMSSETAAARIQAAVAERRGSPARGRGP